MQPYIKAKEIPVPTTNLNFRQIPCNSVLNPAHKSTKNQQTQTNTQRLSVLISSNVDFYRRTKWTDTHRDEQI